MQVVRKSVVNRATNETKVDLTLSLDGSGNYRIDTGIAFLDHMLELFTKHGRFDLELKATGDIAVDGHHTTEDIGICLGKAFEQALGDKIGIKRYGSAIIPMDEALVLAALDLSGRGYLAFDASLPAERMGNFDSELVEEFCRALAMNGAFNLHVRVLAGKNTHHIIEAIFKAIARSLRDAVTITNTNEIPSTKGTLT